MRMLRAHPEFFASSLSPLTSHAAVESVFPLSSLGARGRAVNSTTARSGSSRCPTATRPSCAAWGGSSGDSSKTSEASGNTSAAMTSDLRLPEIAPRSLAGCRVPTRDRSQPARCSATCRPSHVIDVGSATATTPGNEESSHGQVVDLLMLRPSTSRRTDASVSGGASTVKNSWSWPTSRPEPLALSNYRVVIRSRWGRGVTSTARGSWRGHSTHRISRISQRREHHD